MLLISATVFSYFRREGSSVEMTFQRCYVYMTVNSHLPAVTRMTFVCPGYANFGNGRVASARCMRIAHVATLALVKRQARTWSRKPKRVEFPPPPTQFFLPFCVFVLSLSHRLCYLATCGIWCRLWKKYPLL